MIGNTIYVIYVVARLFLFPFLKSKFYSKSGEIRDITINTEKPECDFPLCDFTNPRSQVSAVLHRL